MQQQQAPEHWPQATPPDIWFVYRTNPAISFWDTTQITEVLSRFPFTVCFALTNDETNHFADILLPDRTDLEGLQLIRVGGTKFIEQFWDYQGFALRQPVVEAQGDARDFTWIATELARRSGVLDKYVKAVNRGAAGVPLKGEHYDFSLAEDEAPSVEAVWDATCRAASAEITDGAEDQGLDWYREHGFRVAPFPRVKWYLYAAIEDAGLRFELPYQERLMRVGKQLGRRLHEHGISWWDEQLEEYDPLPEYKNYPEMWEKALERNYRVDIRDYPFWAVTARSMQYAWGGNAGIQMMREVAENVGGHGGVVINATKAAELGLADGDLVEIRSPLNATRGRVVTRQGIRPDTLLMIGQFEHWATPYAKDLELPSLNKLVPMLIDLTDSTGSGADLTRVQVTRVEGAR
jgi:phenylacetyl-CoA:acceptor oxidoreductase